MNITNTDDTTGAVISSTNATWDMPCAYRGTGPDAKYTSDLNFAAAIMVGMGYEVTPGITFDTGYRAVWQGASLGLAANSFDNVTTNIHISNRIDHEWRTGVRFDLH